MKKKVTNILLLIGISAFVALIVIAACGVVDFGTLWLYYAVSGCLLLVFVCLNIRFGRYTLLDETISCLRRARKALAAVKAGKNINYVKRYSIKNQITNSILLVEDLISNREFYTLKDNLEELNVLKEHFQSPEKLHMQFDEATLAADVDILDLLLAELKALK